MIPDEQVLEILHEHIPGLEIPTRAPKSIFKSFDKITDYAVELIRGQEVEKLESLTKKLREIEENCGPRVAMAIENIFLYRIGTWMIGSGDREALLSSIPVEFREKIIQQMICSKI